jgi:hypothetical protein
VLPFHPSFASWPLLLTKKTSMSPADGEVAAMPSASRRCGGTMAQSLAENLTVESVCRFQADLPGLPVARVRGWAPGWKAAPPIGSGDARPRPVMLGAEIDAAALHQPLRP